MTSKNRFLKNSQIYSLKKNTILFEATTVLTSSISTNYLHKNCHLHALEYFIFVLYVPVCVLLEKIFYRSSDTC